MFIQRWLKQKVVCFEKILYKNFIVIKTNNNEGGIMLKVSKFLLLSMLLMSMLLSCGDDSTEPENRPPAAPSNPSPADGATNQSVNVDLSWDCSDPDGDAIIYAVALVGADFSIRADSNLTARTWDPGQLDNNMLYAWAVIAMDEHGDTATSPGWTFTTGAGSGNTPPAAPSSPSPSNGATDQSINTQLSWTCSDPDGDNLTYDIYFGTNSTPPLVESNQSATTYNPGTLLTNTTYYWMIEADDGSAQTEGPTWSFTTFGTGLHLVGSHNCPGWANDVYVVGDYAYVACGGSGLQVYDVSDRANPSWAGGYGAVNSARDVYVSGSYAYIADNENGLLILDISDAGNITLTGSHDTPYRANGVMAQGDYAYIAEFEWALMIYDISTPSSPSYVDEVTFAERARDVWVDGDYAYVADNVGGLQIVNIQNPEAPWAVGNLPLTNESWGVFAEGDYAYVADREGGLKIVDVSNPGSPTLVGTYDTPDRAMGVYKFGDYAYVADMNTGLFIIDVSVPASPSFVDSYDTPREATGVFVDSEYIYVADNNALLIFQLIE